MVSISNVQHQPYNSNRTAGQSGAYRETRGWAGTAGTPDLHAWPAGWPVPACLQQSQGGTRQVKVGELKPHLTFKDSKDDQHIQSNVFVARKEDDMVNRAINDNSKNLRQLESSRSDRLRRFGEQVPALLGAIDEAHRRGQFKRKPRGPLGEKPLCGITLTHTLKPLQKN